MIQAAAAWTCLLGREAEDGSYQLALVVVVALCWSAKRGRRAVAITEPEAEWIQSVSQQCRWS
jgi:hypothetical protein